MSFNYYESFVPAFQGKISEGLDVLDTQRGYTSRFFLPGTI